MIKQFFKPATKPVSACVFTGIFTFCITCCFLIYSSYFLTQAFAMPLSKKVVVIDAGHGGFDPGMVSQGTEEKHINLSISKKLQTFLEQAGATVIITRVDDGDLGRGKSSDMNARKLIANTSHGDIFVSIHQNSFSSGSVKGAQVFFYNQSDNSQKLASFVQEKIVEFVDPANKFDAKANSNYYVLKQTEMPAILVECGFLTNYAERQKLLDTAYQEKIAWAIYLGILDYFNDHINDHINGHINDAADEVPEETPDKSPPEETPKLP